jgi:hypothetical protein
VAGAVIIIKGGDMNNLMTEINRYVNEHKRGDNKFPLLETVNFVRNKFNLNLRMSIDLVHKYLEERSTAHNKAGDRNYNKE